MLDGDNCLLTEIFTLRGLGWLGHVLLVCQPSRCALSARAG